MIKNRNKKIEVLSLGVSPTHSCLSQKKLQTHGDGVVTSHNAQGRASSRKKVFLSINIWHNHSKLESLFPGIHAEAWGQNFHLHTSFGWYTNRNSELEKWIYYFWQIKLGLHTRQMSQTYPSPAPNQDFVSLHSTFLLSLFHSVLRFMPGTFAWILQEVRETNITPPIRQNYSGKFFGELTFQRYPSPGCWPETGNDQSEPKMQAENFRMKF